MDLVREAGLALRRLGSAPGYTAAAVLSLALAIGANSALFSVVNAIVLRPLPIREPDRLVTCWETYPRQNLAIVEVSYRNFRDWQTENWTFTGLAAMGASNWSMVLEGRGDPVRLSFTGVTASFFDVLGTTPALGRSLLPADDLPGAERVVVLSHGAWQRRFGADPALVGRTVTLDQRPYTVVGVMPRDFEYPRGAELWAPLVPILVDAGTQWKMDALENRGLGLLYVLGRLKPGVSLDQATEDLGRVVGDMWRAAPVARPEGQTVVVVPFLDQLVGPVRRVLLWLLGAVGLVLLIGCANVSGLMLTRATERRRADAVRLALGAGRSRLVTAWALEAGWLVLGGALGGLSGAWGLTKAIVAVAPADIPRIAQVSVDGSVVAFTLGVCALATFACALAPAWRSAAADVAAALSDAARGTPGVAPLRARSALVVVEIALAAALLVAGGLMVRSFANLRLLDLGYDPRHVLTLDVAPRGAGNERAFYRDLIARIEALPEVEAVGAVYLRPLAMGPIGQETAVVLQGQSDQEAADRNPYLNYETATPGYFRAMRIHLRAGRLFDERDDARAPKVAIVGESAARRLWPGQDPIGRVLSTPKWSSDGERSMPRTVVGVVADARYRGLDDVRLDYYEPSDQADSNNMARQLIVRTTGNPLAVAAAVQAQARALDRDAVIGGLTTLETIVGRAIAPWRFAVWTFTLFAMLAFVLATGGLFSLVALTVALRSREFAVRRALGAQARDISRRVVLQAGRHALLGVSLGLATAAVGAQWLGSLLFEVRPLDAGTYAAVVAVVLAATAAASLLPARRAARQDVMVVLREE
jgi:putative ABC transport system permease protein